MKKILHIVPSMSAGGIESLLADVYENVNREECRFDFAALNPNNPIHKERMEKLGARVFFIADAGGSSSILSKFNWRLKAIRNYRKLLKETGYDAIHCHQYAEFGIFILFSALKKIPVRIVHVHAAGIAGEKRWKGAARRLWNFLNFDFLITHRVACSDAAAKWLFGKKLFEKGCVKTILNGIDMTRFKNVLVSRCQEMVAIPKGDGIINFAHIGRFATAKNQLFMLDCFHQMTLMRKNIRLHIVGFGELEHPLKQKVNELQLENHVFFYPYNTNIPAFLSQMDYFLLPSIFEGFGIVLVEAQVSGVYCFASKVVIKDVDMGLITYLPLERGPKYWAERIVEFMDSNNEVRTPDPRKVELFDIKNVAKQFEGLYGV